MASSYISFKEGGFWAYDNFIEVIQLCLIKEIENHNLNNDSWLNEFKKAIALHTIPLIHGGRSMFLDEFIIDKKRMTLLVSLLNQIIKKIETHDDIIDGQNLHKLRIDAMQIAYNTHDETKINESEFNKVVNDSRWLEAKNIHKVKDNYLHHFELLVGLISTYKGLLPQGN